MYVPDALRIFRPSRSADVLRISRRLLQRPWPSGPGVFFYAAVSRIASNRNAGTSRYDMGSTAKEHAASRAVNEALREWPEIADIHVNEIDFIG
jgi:hypothetical protein